MLMFSNVYMIYFDQDLFTEFHTLLDYSLACPFEEYCVITFIRDVFSVKLLSVFPSMNSQ